MAWERRKAGLYYYRSRRVGRRVVKEYVGSGPGAVLVAELDVAERAEREAKRQAKAEELERLRAPAEPLGQLSDRLEGVVIEALEAAGYHRHRGEWRRAKGWRGRKG